MSKRIKIWGIAAALLIAVLLVWYAVRAFLSYSDLMASLPVPPDSAQYILLETQDSYFPKSLASALTDGPYAVLRSGTSRSVMIKLASLAQRTGMLIVNEEEGFAEVYAVMKFPSKETKKLRSGEIPDIWKQIIGEARITAGSEKSTWQLAADGTASPVFYTVTRGFVVMAADEEPFKRLLAVRGGTEKSFAGMKWKQEQKWPGHMEIGDGGVLSAGDKPVPIKIQSAWRPLSPKDKNDSSGEAVWSIDGLKAGNKLSFLLGAKARAWDTSNCLIPRPFLLSAGFNIPDMKGSPEEWPFPLNLIGEWGIKLNLGEKKVKEILSGQTVFSLGGYNRLLWFTLPGVLIEFTGEKKLMEELVSSFWDNLSLGAEPKKLDGFEFGGASNMPFSIIGAGRGNMAFIGLMSPDSIDGGDKLERFLRDGEKAVGWLIVDLPRLGGALSDMTKMNSLMQEDGEDEGHISGSDDGGTGFPASGMDQGVSDSFGNLLKKFGKAVVVWETPSSGRMSWYGGSEADTAEK